MNIDRMFSTCPIVALGFIGANSFNLYNNLMRYVLISLHFTEVGMEAQKDSNLPKLDT